ncbi:MAG TPA: hypothetical protein VM008_12980 [Phycisphaerae bacterium]|nr:hypothetical protein [Phycisphaerae bacterium]
MGFLNTLRDKLAGAVLHRPVVCNDPVLGVLEEIGGGLWQTVQPVLIRDDMEPVVVTIEGDLLLDHCAGEWGRDVYVQLRQRYDALWQAIGPMICSVSPRICADRLWDHAVLVGVEIWRAPGSGEAALALEYQISDEPEYVYVVRVEGWKPVDVTITG